MMRTAARILGTRLWYRHALYVSGAVRRAEFTRKFERFASPETGYGLNPRLQCDWEAGKRSVSNVIVRRVEGLVGGTEDVLAIARLLKPKPMSAPAAGRTVENLYVAQPDGRRLWILPHIGAFETASGGATSYSWDDSASLASRGDFPGMLAILALLRESVARADFHRIARHAQDLYAILPSVARLGWVRPDVDLLLQCIEDMMVGIRWIPARITIDWDAFRAQMSNPRLWRDVPPWIVHSTDNFAQRSSHQLTLRPVPLLADVEPLRRYVRAPLRRDEQRPRRLGTFWSMLARD
jgi:hypothetical protein